MHNESAYTTTSVISYEYRVQLLRVSIFTCVSKTKSWRVNTKLLKNSWTEGPEILFKFKVL